MTTRRSPIFLHIERLELDGIFLSAPQSVRMQKAMEGELVRLLGSASSRRDNWSGGSHGECSIRSNRQGTVSWDGARPQALGRALARSVISSLTDQGSLSARRRGQP